MNEAAQQDTAGIPPGTTAVEQRFLRMPHAAPGLTVALFGGSFNPPHEGHALVAEIALKRLRLDQLWWIVTPGNPLKDHGELVPLTRRLAESRAFAGDPRIRVTAFEAVYRTAFTAQTLELVQARNPAVRFVWLMGADNLAGFHRWQNWRDIVRRVPIAVIDRPGSTLSYLSAKMAKTFERARVDETDAARLAFMKPPAWTFIHGPRSGLSSTAIRGAAGGRDESGRTT